MSTCTHAHIADTRHLHKSTTLPQCSLCIYTPNTMPPPPTPASPHRIPPAPITTTTTTTILCFQALSFSSTLFFLQGHFESWICCWMCFDCSDSCSCYISMVHGCEFIVCPQSLHVHLWDLMTMHVKHPYTGTSLASMTSAHLGFLSCPALWPSIHTLFIWGQYVSSCSWKENGS